MVNYNFSEIENKWKKRWEDEKIFATDVWDFSKPKYYVLDMFPYPSGKGLHVGHVEGYTATDIVARFKKMQGFNVLHPMGYDSFGLPAEQFAIDTGNHPDGFTKQNIDTYTRQLKMLGFSYDWDRVISTCDSSFYKWTQWIFKQLYLDGQVKFGDMPVNWCEALGTVLANDEIIDGVSERGGHPVTRKNLSQLVIDTPAYAEKLLRGLDELDWPVSTKEMQRNWIGKSEGVEVSFKLNTGDSFKIFTTCIETIYGITFMVLAPESEIVTKLKDKILNWKEVESYKTETLKKSDLERGDMNKGKTGCILKGITAINPVNGKEVPVFVADFVIASYGTGAVMAVPAHDQRDFEFALKHKIPMIQVIDGKDTKESAFEKGDYLGKNCVLENSEEFNGLIVEDAKEKITSKLEKMGVAERKINYRLREWIFARQRYWGEPIPLVYMDNGEVKVLDDKDLPLVLPEINEFKAKNGKAPLDNAVDWVNVEIDGQKGKRETSTMPGSAGSSWYYLRYIDPKNDKEIADPKLLNHWMPVDLYVGGPEHAVGHLIYSRYFNNYLFDKGIVPVSEPFKKLVHPGMILGGNNEKMSKSRGNVINPDDIVRDYGTDTLRLYEMFLGPLKEAKPWKTENIDGSKRFIERVWRLYTEENKISDTENTNLDKVYNQTVKKVTEDFETLCFNTAISQMMIFVNAVYKEDSFPRKYAEGFIKLLDPISPFVCEEIWETALGHKESIALSSWPTYDNKVLEDSIVEIPVQICGKVKTKIMIEMTDNEKDVISKINKEYPDLFKGQSIKKVIFVKGRIINFII
ncbi:MAG: leucine--tRNA ligase [Clostridia bacterium]